MTVYTGIKLTHDAAVAHIDNGKLLFSIESEKIANRERHACFETVGQALSDVGLYPEDTGTISIDGWKGSEAKGLPVAPYHEDDGEFSHGFFGEWTSSHGSLKYSSFLHLTNHVTGAYAMSPFDGPCNVLVWDGGTSPRMYAVDPRKASVSCIGVAFHYYGMLYSIMNYYFGPFKVEDFRRDPEAKQFGNYSWPGKIMSYYGRGNPTPDFLAYVAGQFGIYSRAYERTRGRSYYQDGSPEHALCASIRDAIRYDSDFRDVTDEDALAAIHEVIAARLVVFAQECAGRNPAAGARLIFTGGSALNIKWNSDLRKAGFLLFVPPCPNDSGSAIGAAVTARIVRQGLWKIDWNVYSGPDLIHDAPPAGWNTFGGVTPREIASLISQGEIVCALHGRAEIGPRALGSRSLLASPVYPNMKDRLNKLKRREGWRPVAPIVATYRANEFFFPGTPDPFMLFDHSATKITKDRAPTIVHEDGTARVQTLYRTDLPQTAAILRAFEDITDLPILCNTSANALGKGFFPSISSACEWATGTECRHVWDGDNNILYTQN